MISTDEEIEEKIRECWFPAMEAEITNLKESTNYKLSVRNILGIRH
jgi:hypothetical protein